MEKRGVIAPGVTPPEEPTEKRASDLEAHPTQRLADAVAEATKEAEKKLPDGAKRRF